MLSPTRQALSPTRVGDHRARREEGHPYATVSWGNWHGRLS